MTKRGIRKIIRNSVFYIFIKHSYSFLFGLHFKRCSHRNIRAKDYGRISSHITRPEDMAGSIDPFSPTWEVQSLLDGNQQFFETEEESKEWIKELTD